MSAKQKLISQQIADQLRDKIHRGQLLPGNPLNLVALREELGVSISPVRDATKLLEREGYVQVVPRRGVFVRQVEVEEILEAYDFRLAIEPVMVELAAAHISEAQIKKLQENYRSLLTIEGGSASEAFRAMDMALHVTVTEHCPNRIFKSMISSIVGYIEWSSGYALRNMPDSLPDTVEEHLKVCDALLRRDIAAAAEAMRQHLLATRARITTYMGVSASK